MDIRVLKRLSWKVCARVLLAVNHFSYSAAILLLSQDVIYVGAWSRWCKLRDVNGAQGCAAVVVVVV